MMNSLKEPNFSGLNFEPFSIELYPAAKIYNY
jgi:hypothetical protein